MPPFASTDRESFSASLPLLRVVALLALPSANLNLNSQVASLVVDAPHPQAPPAFTAVGDWTPQEETTFFPLNGKRRYDIGDLTGDEQAYVELINRARIDPKAEGRRLVETEDPDVLGAYRSLNVDLDWVLNAPEEGFNHLPVAGVLVPNAALTKAARRHTQDMFDNNFQGHGGSDGSRPENRAKDAGYSWTAIGENVYAYAKSIFHGHAGFNVDWGRNEPQGIQNPPGHRLSIHNPIWKEVGVGVINGSKGDVGPQLVTQEFGTRQNITPFVTGVAYYDLNGNRFYDSGEGLGGIRVDVKGSDFYALTHNSGGFGVPVPRNGRYQVTFSEAGFAEKIESVAVSRSRNAKVDFTPIYRPPQIAGPDTIPPRMDTSFTFSTVDGATAYQWRQNLLIPIDGVEGAETRLSDFEEETTGRYSARTSSVKHSGRYSFRLVHPTGDKQILNWNRVFRPGRSGALRFQSRLTVATSDEIAQVEASVDGGAHWTVIWSQAGSARGSSQRGEPRFFRRTADLSSFAFQHIRLRFVFALKNGGRFFPYNGSSPSEWGWYFDDLELVDTMEIVEPSLHEVEEAGRFAFAPLIEDDYLLEVRAKVSDRWYPFGPSKLITASRSAIIEPPPVNRPVLTITANDVMREFGETNPVFMVSYSGFVNEEGPDVLGGILEFDEGGGTEEAVAGVYDLTPSGLTSSNYNIVFVGGSITVTKAPAEVTLGDLVQGHDGLPKTVSVVTVPEGLNVDVTYDGSMDAPMVQGSYAVSAVVNDPRYSGSAEGTLKITDLAMVTLADLAQVYDGTARVVSVVTDPPGLAVEVTYDGGEAVPVAAGTYEVRARIADPDEVYSGFAEAELVVAKGSAQVSFVPGSLTRPINEIAAAEVVTVPAGLAARITYGEGFDALPQLIGRYDVVAVIEDPNWVGSVMGVFEIVRAPQEIRMLLPVPIGVELIGEAREIPLIATATSDDLVNFPIEFLVGEGTDASAFASVSGNRLVIRGTGDVELVVRQAGDEYWAPVERTFMIEATGQPAVRLAEIEVSDLEQEYDGNPKAVGVVTVPAGLAVVITYDGSLEVPVDAGTYEVRVEVNEEGYEGVAVAMLTITPSARKIPVDIEITNLEHRYDGNPKSAMVSLDPAGVAVSITYNGSPESPVDAGTYEVRVLVTAETHEGFKIATLTITSGEAGISFVEASLSQLVGEVRPVEVVTEPAGLNVRVMYDGSADVPAAVGEYEVVATVEDRNWEGRATGTFRIRLASQEITVGDLTDYRPWPIAMEGTQMIISLPVVGATSGLPVTLEVDEVNSTGEATLFPSGTRLNVTQPGDIVLIARQAGDDRWAPAERSFTVTVTGRGVPVQTPVIRLTSLEIANGQVRVVFEADFGEPQAFDLLTALDPSGPWRIDPTANILALDNGFAATTSATGTDEQYYRIQSR